MQDTRVEATFPIAETGKMQESARPARAGDQVFLVFQTVVKRAQELNPTDRHLNLMAFVATAKVGDKLELPNGTFVFKSFDRTTGQAILVPEKKSDKETTVTLGNIYKKMHEHDALKNLPHDQKEFFEDLFIRDGRNDTFQPHFDPTHAENLSSVATSLGFPTPETIQQVAAQSNQIQRATDSIRQLLAEFPPDTKVILPADLEDLKNKLLAEAATIMKKSQVCKKQLWMLKNGVPVIPRF